MNGLDLLIIIAGACLFVLVNNTLNFINSQKTTKKGTKKSWMRDIK